MARQPDPPPTASLARHAARRLAVALAGSRAGTISLWVAMAIPVFLVAGGVALNVGEGLLARQRVQLAADLAAQAGAISYGRDVEAQRAAGTAADVAELNGAVLPASRSWNAGANTLTAGEATITLGPGVTDATRTAVTVTVARPVDMAFASLLGTATRTVSATGIAEAWNLPSGGGGGGPACVLALHPTLASAIKVDNMGHIFATGCGIHANSTANSNSSGAAIYLNSGTLSGQSIGTPGRICLSNSGSNTISPSMPNNSCRNPASAAAAYPFAAMPAPVPSQPSGCAVNASFGACCIPPVTGTVGSHNSGQTNVTGANYTAWQATPRQFSPANGGVFCGSTSIGGNGTADRFQPGIYYVINGDLTFTNSNITLADGVSFVLIGRNGGNPGKIRWSNHSNTYALSAPATGPTAGVVFWQGCPASGEAPTSQMDGGSTLSLNGAFYARCGGLELTNNVRLQSAAGASMRVVARTLYVAGSARINAAASAPPPAAANVALVR
jgi:Flp pilus assembly protein TadG